MGVFGAVFGRRGDGGFSGPLLWVCRGDGGFSGPLLWASSDVVGFNVAMFLCPMRELFRPARLGAGVSAKKFALLGPSDV